MKRVLCIWLPNWPIQRLLVARPELKDRTIILYARQGSRGQRVVACSSAARAVGVRRDMPLAEAMTLRRQARHRSDNKPSATPAVFHAEPYDPIIDRQELVRLAEWCERFTPIVGLEQTGDTSRGELEEPESLLLDVTGLGPLFGGEEAMARRVVTELAACGYAARVAVGDAIGVAWGVARFADDNLPPFAVRPIVPSPPQQSPQASQFCRVSSDCSGREGQGEGENRAPFRPLSLTLSPVNLPSNSPVQHEFAPQIDEGEGTRHSSCATSKPPADAPPRSDMWVIPAGQAEAAMGPLPLEALRLPATLIAVLRQLGIQYTCELLRLPRTSLSSRWGDGILLRIDQALGNAGEPIIAHHAPPSFEATWSLEYPTEQRDAVEFVVEQLIARVAHLLAERGRGAVRLEIRLRCVDLYAGEEPGQEPSGESERLTIHGSPARNESPNSPLKNKNSRELLFRLDLFRPTAVVRHLAELTRLQFDQITWSTAVQEVTVQTPLTAPLEIRQGELFGEAVRDGQRQVALLIDRLSSRLGRERVLQPRLIADAQPERACRYLPLAGRPPRRRGRAPEAAPRSPLQAFDRPLHLRHPPRPLQVLAAAPDGPPARFQLQHRWHDVVRYWGPERIETGWWRERTVRRDYYRVETESHQWFWLFHQLHDNRWFLHGEW